MDKDEKLLENSRVKEWILWAKKKVNWFDPFVEAKDELLSEEDRNKI